MRRKALAVLLIVAVLALGLSSAAAAESPKGANLLSTPAFASLLPGQSLKIKAVAVYPIRLRADVTPNCAFSACVYRETYWWKYNGKTYALSVDVPKDLYDYSRSIHYDTKKFYETDPYTRYQMLLSMPEYERKMVYACSAGGEANYVYWVDEPKNSAFIEKAAGALLEIARKENFNRFQTAEFVLSFVQSIPYVLTEYPVLPVQTLVDKKGDCDVKSILLAAILKKMGYDVALLYFSPAVTGKGTGHMAVGVAFDESELPANRSLSCDEYAGKTYCFAETTCSLPIGASAYTWSAVVLPV